MGVLNVSKNFTQYDVEFNEVAYRLGIKNQIDPSLLVNAELLAENILEPLLERFPELAITSWYRCAALEKEYARLNFARFCIAKRMAINEVSWKEYMQDNQHDTGCAVTFRVRDIDAAFKYIRDGLEFDVLQHKEHWISVSFAANNRKRVINKG